ncbi:hypothetical protein PMIN06_009217 [Paraphaeosphaeria minitans]
MDPTDNISTTKPTSPTLDASAVSGKKSYYCPSVCRTVLCIESTALLSAEGNVYCTCQVKGTQQSLCVPEVRIFVHGLLCTHECGRQSGWLAGFCPPATQGPRVLTYREIGLTAASPHLASPDAMGGDGLPYHDLSRHPNPANQT